VFLSACWSGAGFLWFNSHPAEVFMGDTGRCRWAPRLGAVALLVKHELLLILIGGIFRHRGALRGAAGGQLPAARQADPADVAAAQSLREERVAESKIIARFLIVATLLALAGLCTLKLEVTE